MPDHPADVLDTAPKQERVIIRPYPKAVVYYPTMFVAFLCALWMWFQPNVSVMIDGVATPVANQLPGRIFYLVFFFNTLTIAFDFTRVIFIATCLFFGLLVTFFFLMESWNIPVFEALGSFFRYFEITASPGFFLAFGLLFFVIFIGIFLQTRFNYWEVKHNELLHHHGIAGDVERYPAPNLRMSKEITDVFEYVLLFSGRLVLYPANSERPVVLDHVVRINSMEKRVEKMLQTLQVRFEGGGPPPAGKG